MLIRNIELPDIDVADADVMELFESECEKIKQGVDFTGLSRSQAIRKQCTMVFECFNNLFGEGTAKKLFGDKTNLVECVSAFEELCKAINEADNKIGQMFRNKAKTNNKPSNSKQFKNRNYHPKHRKRR